MLNELFSGTDKEQAPSSSTTPPFINQSLYQNLSPVAKMDISLNPEPLDKRSMPVNLKRTATPSVLMLFKPTCLLSSRRRIGQPSRGPVGASVPVAKAIDQQQLRVEPGQARR
jgi:hypothetical protein